MSGDKDRKRRILFAINGLGLGNSTRCYSIIQELYESGYEIAVATSGNGLFFFSDKPEVSVLVPLSSLQYGCSKARKLDLFLTLLSIPKFIDVTRKNARLLMRLIRTIQPCVVVYDSMYNIAPRICSHIPLLAINNADMIAGQFFRIRKKPLSIFPQFVFVELIDYLFHLLIPTLTMSPGLQPDDGTSRNGGYRKLALVVRKPFRGHEWTSNNTVGRIVIMLSGSSFGSAIDPSAWGLPYEFDIIGRGGISSGNIRFHGKVSEDSEILTRADLFIVNGGYSAIAEALAMRKPVVVIPVPNHAEQYLNGRIVEELGVGLVASDDNVRDQLGKICASYPRFAAAYNALELPADGGKTAAQIIDGICRGLSALQPGDR